MKSQSRERRQKPCESIRLQLEWFAVTWQHATYTEDAVLMPPNGPAVQGRDDIQAFWESFPPVADLDLANVEIAGRGDLAYVRGTYKLKIVL